MLSADDPEGEEQVNDVLAHIREYESERDEQFLRYVKIEGISQSGIEPELRRKLLVKECHQHNFEKALALAKSLKERFPEWSKHYNIDNDMHMLQNHESPYPTLEEMQSKWRSQSKP